MKFSLLKALLVSSLLTVSVSAVAANNVSTITSTDPHVNAIKETLSDLFGEKVDQVNKTPFNGLYEVVMGDTIMYTDENANYVLAGQLVDIKNRRNLTEDRLQDINRIDFKTLPFDKAIKRVIGTGEHKIFTFEDPNCKWCHKLHGELSKLQNVTIYTYLIPIISKDSIPKVRNIVCSSDQATAWADWMEHNKVPQEAPSDCKFSVKESLAMAAKFKVTGTPTIFFENGKSISGYVPVAYLERVMDAN